MMPTVQQMLASVQLALNEQVAPKVDDQWAQSALRSVDAILNHLQARVPEEGSVLHEDTRDLVDCLKFACEQMDDNSGQIGTYLARCEQEMDGYPKVEALQALSHTGRSILDELLVRCHQSKADPAADAVHGRLREYLLRRCDRESSWFFPVYVGRPV